MENSISRTELMESALPERSEKSTEEINPEENTNYKILNHFQSASGCDAYRSFLPVKNCHKELLNDSISLYMSMEVDPNPAYDCYIFHRILPSDFFSVIYSLKKAGKTIVWDLDDNLFIIPEWNPAHRSFRAVERNLLIMCLMEADYITVSTQTIGQQLIEFIGLDPNKIAVLPNLIDAAGWPLTPPVSASPTGNPRKKRVMWAGSESHKADLEIVTPAILRLAEERDDVHFYFVGMVPTELIAKIEPNKLTFITGCPVKYYANLLSTIEPDISLAPLSDCPFNQGKSGIKYLEGTMAGAMTIASDVGPYRETIENPDHTGNNINGWLSVKNDSDDFYELISNALDRESTRKIVATNAKIHTIRNHSWQSRRRDEWMLFFKHLAGIGEQGEKQFQETVGPVAW